MVITMAVTTTPVEAILMDVFIIVRQTAGLINIMECQDEVHLMPHIVIPEQRAFRLTTQVGPVGVAAPIKYIRAGLLIPIPPQELKMFRAAEEVKIIQVHPERIRQAIVSQEHIAALHIMNQDQARPDLRVHPGLKVHR